MPLASPPTTGDPGTAIIADPRNDQTDHPPAPRGDAEVPQQVGRHSARKERRGRPCSRRLGGWPRWHYQWIVTHEFIPAIVGQTMSDPGVQGSRRPAPRRSPSSTTSPRTQLGAPFIPVEFSVAASLAQHHPAPLHRPGRLRQCWHAPWLRLRRAAVPGHSSRQQPERTPRTAASAEDPMEQVLQRCRAEADRPAGAPIRRHYGRPTVQAAIDGAARHQQSRLLSHGTFAGAEDGSAPRDSRWRG